MGADPERVYLRPYLINLALFIKDAKTSYSIIIKETNLIKLLRKKHPKNDDRHIRELRRYNCKMTDHLSKRRIALMSFAGSCGIISSFLWPYVDESKFMNNQAISKLDRKKKERKDHLKDLFPKNCFPHLKKHFRDTLMHSDLNLDNHSIRNKHL